ncbi:hypothetical protein COBT_000610 [Conglomerata obtusa]
MDNTNLYITTNNPSQNGILTAYITSPLPHYFKLLTAYVTSTLTTCEGEFKILESVPVVLRLNQIFKQTMVVSVYLPHDVMPSYETEHFRVRYFFYVKAYDWFVMRKEFVVRKTCESFIHAGLRVIEQMMCRVDIKADTKDIACITDVNNEKIIKEGKNSFYYYELKDGMIVKCDKKTENIKDTKNQHECSNTNNFYEDRIVLINNSSDIIGSNQNESNIIETSLIDSKNDKNEIFIGKENVSKTTMPLINLKCINKNIILVKKDNVIKSNENDNTEYNKNHVDDSLIIENSNFTLNNDQEVLIKDPIEINNHNINDHVENNYEENDHIKKEIVLDIHKDNYQKLKKHIEIDHISKVDKKIDPTSLDDIKIQNYDNEAKTKPSFDNIKMSKNIIQNKTLKTHLEKSNKNSSKNIFMQNTQINAKENNFLDKYSVKNDTDINLEDIARMEFEKIYRQIDLSNIATTDQSLELIDKTLKKNKFPDSIFESDFITINLKYKSNLQKYILKDKKLIHQRQRTFSVKSQGTEIAEIKVPSYFKVNKKNLIDFIFKKNTENIAINIKHIEKEVKFNLEYEQNIYFNKINTDFCTYKTVDILVPENAAFSIECSHFLSSFVICIWLGSNEIEIPICIRQ